MSKDLETLMQERVHSHTSVFAFLTELQIRDDVDSVKKILELTRPSKGWSPKNKFRVPPGMMISDRAYQSLSEEERLNLRFMQEHPKGHATRQARKDAFDFLEQKYADDIGIFYDAAQHIREIDAAKSLRIMMKLAGGTPGLAFKSYIRIGAKKISPHMDTGYAGHGNDWASFTTRYKEGMGDVHAMGSLYTVGVFNANVFNFYPPEILEDLLLTPITTPYSEKQEERKAEALAKRGIAINFDEWVRNDEARETYQLKWRKNTPDLTFKERIIVAGYEVATLIQSKLEERARRIEGTTALIERYDASAQIHQLEDLAENATKDGLEARRKTELERQKNASIMAIAGQTIKAIGGHRHHDVVNQLRQASIVHSSLTKLSCEVYIQGASCLDHEFKQHLKELTDSFDFNFTNQRKLSKSIGRYVSAQYDPDKTAKEIEDTFKTKYQAVVRRSGIPEDRLKHTHLEELVKHSIRFHYSNKKLEEMSREAKEATEELSYGVIDFETVAKNAAKKAIKAKGNCNITYQIAPGLPAVEGFIQVLTDTLADQIKNSIEHGNAADVTVKIETNLANLPISAERLPERGVYIAITDNGQGIPSAKAEQITSYLLDSNRTHGRSFSSREDQTFEGGLGYDLMGRYLDFCNGIGMVERLNEGGTAVYTVIPTTE